MQLLLCHENRRKENSQPNYLHNDGSLRAAKSSGRPYGNVHFG